MATCPVCHGYLGDNHVCRGRAKRIWWWLKVMTVSVVLGGIAGSALFGAVGQMLNMPGTETVGLIIGPIATFIVLRSLQQW